MTTHCVEKLIKSTSPLSDGKTWDFLALSCVFACRKTVASRQPLLGLEKSSHIQTFSLPLQTSLNSYSRPSWSARSLSDPNKALFISFQPPDQSLHSSSRLTRLSAQILDHALLETLRDVVWHFGVYTYLFSCWEVDEKIDASHKSVRYSQMLSLVERKEWKQREEAILARSWHHEARLQAPLKLTDW